MYDVCQALVLHDLGGLISPPRNYSVAEAYEYSDKATPVVFLLPSSVCGQAKQDSSSGERYKSLNGMEWK